MSNNLTHNVNLMQCAYEVVYINCIVGRAGFEGKTSWSGFVGVSCISEPVPQLHALLSHYEVQFDVTILEGHAQFVIN